jgi:hypothetical protein
MADTEFDFDGLRLIEIGDVPFVKDIFPSQTTYFSTSPRETYGRAEDGYHALTLRTLAPFIAKIRDPSLSLIICHPTGVSPWHWDWLSRCIFSRRLFQGQMPFLRAFAPQFLRLPVRAPIIVLDFPDLRLINTNNLFLLDRSRFYFKRELPADNWQVFQKTAHRNSPTPRFRNSSRQRDRVSKLRPLPLGIPTTRVQMLPIDSQPKKSDIFFAGLIDGSSTVRKRGLSELVALRERGIKVDIPEQRLPPEEFYKRCGEAWLTWSPEGLGWDCFRHYEAPVCGSVPLINRPTIERFMPLQDGEHAVYYDIEPGGLTRAATHALSDKAQLQAMADAAKAHVMSYHTPSAIARYVVSTGLSA